jgi:hypothetical protein
MAALSRRSTLECRLHGTARAMFAKRKRNNQDVVHILAKVVIAH